LCLTRSALARCRAFHFTAGRNVGTRTTSVVIGGDENLHLPRGVAKWFEVFVVGKKVEE
jgi:hypothetical protein